MNQAVLPQFYAILWLPYLYAIWHFYRRRSYMTVIILVWAGLLGYRLPIVGMMDGRMFEIGILLCLSYDLLELRFFKRQKFNYDHVIGGAVAIYLFLFLLSAISSRQDTYIIKIYRTINPCLLFFISIKCIRSFNDVLNLLKGIVYGISVVAIIGFIGYAIDDPWFGTTSGDDENIMLAKMERDLSFGEKFALNTQLSRGISENRSYIVSTTRSPHSFGFLMLFNMFILLYFWFKARKQLTKFLILMLLAASISGLIMSAARAAFIAGGISIVFLFINFFRGRKFRIGFGQSFTIIIILLVMIISLSLNTDISQSAAKNIQRITSIEEFLKANGRNTRWAYAISQLEPSMMLIGRGKSGAEGTYGAHNTYLQILYGGGGISLIAFFVFFIRSIKNTTRLGDRLLGLCLLGILLTYGITGMAYEHAYSLSRGAVFWPVIAILSSSYSFKRNINREFKW